MKPNLELKYPQNDWGTFVVKPFIYSSFTADPGLQDRRFAFAPIVSLVILILNLSTARRCDGFPTLLVLRNVEALLPRPTLCLPVSRTL